MLKELRRKTQGRGKARLPSISQYSTEIYTTSPDGAVQPFNISAIHAIQAGRQRSESEGVRRGTYQLSVDTLGLR